MKICLKAIILFWFLCQTNNGISQADAWEIFNTANSQIPDNTIRCLQVDSLDRLWIGTDNGLALRSTDGSWQIFNESNSGLADDYVRALAVDTNNTLWIGTTLGGVQKFDGSTWTTYNTGNSDLVDNFIRTISVDHYNNKWIGTVEGLVYFDDVNWTTWQMADSPILTNNIASIGIGQDNEKYIGTINGGLIYMDSGTSFTGIYTILNAGVPDNSSLKVKVDNLGKPWYAGSSGGLFTDTGNQTWLAFNHNNSGLPTNSLTTMELDEIQNFYLGTQQCGLIIRHFDQTWTYFTAQNSELPENHILSLVKNGDDLWIGTFSKGLVRLREDELSVFETEKQSQLVVFPNPVAQEGIIYFNKSLDDTKIRIFTPEGKLFDTTIHLSSDNSIQLNGLSAGTYLIELQKNDKAERIRFVIM
jgi:ligand-binding sensor domain-containing protein